MGKQGKDSIFLCAADGDPDIFQERDQIFSAEFFPDPYEIILRDAVLPGLAMVFRVADKSGAQKTGLLFHAVAGAVLQRPDADHIGVSLLPVLHSRGFRGIGILIIRGIFIPRIRSFGMISVCSIGMMGICSFDSCQDPLLQCCKRFDIIDDMDLGVFFFFLNDIAVKTGQEVFESQFRAQFKGFAGIIALCLCFFGVQLHIAVCLDGHEEKAHAGLVFVLLQISVKSGLFDLIEVKVYTVDRAVVFDQGDGSLLSHLGDTGDVVRGISHQGLDVDELAGCHAIGLNDLVSAEIVDHGLSLAGAGDADGDPVGRDLQKVPVSGQKDDIHVLSLRLLGKGSENIVCLKACLFTDLDPHGSEHFFHQRNLLTELIGHGFARALVVRIGVVPECRRMHVKSHRQIIRLQLVQLAEKDIEKSIDRTGMQTFGVRQVRHAVKGAVENAVSVDQQKFLFFIAHCVLIAHRG